MSLILNQVNTLMQNMPKKDKVHLYEGGRHVLTDGISINQKIHFIMKKKVKLVSKLEDKALVKKAIKTSENEKMDLYKSIFGGNVEANSCIVAISEVDGASAAYNRTGQFLRV